MYVAVCSARAQRSTCTHTRLAPCFHQAQPLSRLRGKQVLEEFGVPLELTVVSAHRTPERMMEYAKTAHKRGLKVIIAGAGGFAVCVWLPS